MSIGEHAIGEYAIGEHPVAIPSTVPGRLHVDKRALLAPELLEPGKRPVSLVENASDASGIFSFQNPGIPISLTGNGSATAISSGVTHSHKGVNIPTGANSIRLPLSFYNHNGPVTLTFLFNVGSSESLRCLAAMFPSSGADNLFAVYLGQPATGELENELITIAKYVGAVAKICGYTTTDRAELFDGQDHIITITSNGSTFKLFLDGMNVTLSGTNSGIYYSSSVTYFDLGGRTYNGSRSIGMGGDIKIFRFDTRVLSDGEIIEIHRHPYGTLFQAI